MPLGVCLVTKAPRISWSAFHRSTRLSEPASTSGISCSRDRLRWTARRVMTSKYGPPAPPDAVDQLPPNWPPPLAIPALALGAFGLGTNEFAAMGHMIWLTRGGARLLRVEHHQRDGRLDRRCGDRRGLRVHRSCRGRCGTGRRRACRPDDFGAQPTPRGRPRARA
jgi:hypothetical protein